MQIKNYPTVPVDGTAGGTVVITDAQIQAARSELGGVKYLLISTTVALKVVDGKTDGTYANSPAYIPVSDQPTVIDHTSGPLRLITAGGAATVQIAVVGGP